MSRLIDVPIKVLLRTKGDGMYSMLKRAYRLASRIHGCAVEECRDSTHMRFVSETWYSMYSAGLSMYDYYMAQGYGNR